LRADLRGWIRTREQARNVQARLRLIRGSAQGIHR